jgi:hypothetical protein
LRSRVPVTRSEPDHERTSSGSRSSPRVLRSRDQGPDSRPVPSGGPCGGSARERWGPVTYLHSASLRAREPP